jgi:GNAT superfamily N-acetyltransferase
VARARTGTDEQPVRLATAVDHAGVVACVRAAHAHYVPRMGQQPAPMLADYAALVAAGQVRVIGSADDIRAALVSEARAEHVFIEDVAVRPDLQGHGLGTRLLAVDGQDARRLRLPELRLYTHELMTENLDYYVRRAFEEIARRVEDRYARVFMRKVVAADG